MKILNLVSLSILLVFLAGCAATIEQKTFKLSNGDTVEFTSFKHSHPLEPQSAGLVKRTYNDKGQVKKEDTFLAIQDGWLKGFFSAAALAAGIGAGLAHSGDSILEGNNTVTGGSAVVSPSQSQSIVNKAGSWKKKKPPVQPQK